MSDEKVGRIVREGFALIPDAVLFAGVSSRAIHLYALLWRHASPEGAAYPGRKRLAGLLGVSEDTVKRAKQELMEAGAIEVEACYRADGGRTTDTIRLRHPRRSSAPGGRSAGAPTRTRGSSELSLRGEDGAQSTPPSSPGQASPSEEQGAAVQSLVAHYVECAQRVGVSPPGRLKASLGRAAKQLLSEGTEVRDLRLAVRWAAEENKPPGALALLVMDVQKLRHEKENGHEDPRRRPYHPR